MNLNELHAALEDAELCLRAARHQHDVALMDWDEEKQELAERELEQWTAEVDRLGYEIQKLEAAA